MIAWIRNYWKLHGTKIWGFITSFIGIIGEVLTYLQQMDPKRALLWGLIIIIGGGVIKRGFTNTKNQQ